MRYHYFYIYMSVTLGKVGTITRKRFLESEATLLDVLKQRLKGADKDTRSNIRQMIRRVV
jgi:hypothetical protein